MKLAVVVVTYESESHVGETLRAVVEQLADGDELVVVDNASTDGTATKARAAAPSARVLEQRRNVGFASACNAGVNATSAPLLLFLNPDATLERGCIDALRSAAAEHPRWGAWQALVTMNASGAINTSGGVTHFLGMGWAGQCGEPIESAPAAPTEISFASGAALCVRRTAWEAVGGFDDRYFMYGEDLDLGLRLWLGGFGVGIVPAARVQHEYEFTKGNQKWFLLERNRWWTIVSDYPGALLLLLMPALMLGEVALLLMAARGGWLGAKLRAQAAVIRQLPQMLARRRQVQARRTAGARVLAERLSATLDNPNLDTAALPPWARMLQAAYWDAVVKTLERSGGRAA
jgi:N-acetylglucosaminyl-diphospho-decaprenol L-rhamnosyltransferase